MTKDPKSRPGRPNEVEELRLEVEYLRRITEGSLARLLQVDSRSIAIRHELEQKRRGFHLVSELAVNLEPGADYKSIFVLVSRRLNAALNMQRTTVLRPEGEGLFQALVLQGYGDDEIAEASALMPLEPELLDHQRPVLITGVDPPERLADFRRKMSLPYLISAPVMINNQVAAIVVTGRQAEEPPFLPRLGASDVETVQTVSAYLAAILTGQRLEEEEARKEDLEEIMRAVFKASVDGYTVWTAGHIERVSQGVLDLLELGDKEEFIRHNHRYGMTNKHLAGIFKQVRVEGQVTEEVVLRSESGELVPCEVRHLPLKFHNATSLLSYVRDLRPQKKNEEALRAAKEKAEVAAQAKSDFLANMSHEIRTPMNAMVGLIHLIKDTGLDQRQTEYLGRIEDSTRSLLRIINDVLDFSKIDAGRLEMESAEFDLASILREVVSFNLPVAEQKGLELILSETPDLKSSLMGDAMRLQQVLNNLIGNALKFTAEGRVAVSVRLLGPNGAKHRRKPLGPGFIAREQVSAAAHPDKSGAKRGDDRVGLEFEIRDTGIGFSPEQAEKLFVAFTQADTSTTRQYGGTGLGLAISKKLVELMGGEIWAEGRSGQGAAFYFTAFFGQAAGVSKPADSRAHSAVEAQAAAARIKGARILLVEDNEVNQLVARRIMEKAGLMVTIADNGRKALERLTETGGEPPFDLVLMDIQMPEMDGLTATRHIRANPDWADLPVVAMTAHALSGDRELSLQAGMNDHITKPINLTELFVTLARWIRPDGRGTD